MTTDDSYTGVPGHAPQSQGDGCPEPLYAVEVPERGLEVRVTVQTLPPAPEDRELSESGYGHGV
ncbi:MAG: hypothetical protein AB1635_06180 [Acidobacteriota bacterium]